MKSKLSALVVLALGLSLGNCDLLGVKLIDTEDFSIKDFKPSPSAKFIKGLEFTSATVVDELLGAGKDADLEIPLLGDAMKKAGAPGGLIILAKEVKYKGDYKWQLAALIKFEGDKLQYKQQKFPAASGEGKYGMFFAATKYAFVTGVAVDCKGKAKSGIWVISGNKHNYLTKTNGAGKYGLPFEVGKTKGAGKSISLSIADEDCKGGGAVSVPMNPAGDAEVVEKQDENGGTVDSNCEMEAASGGDETVTRADDAPPLRETPDSREVTGSVCDDVKVVVLGSSVQEGTLDEIKTSSNSATATCFDNKVVISTGGSSVAGTGAAIDFDATGKTSVTVVYSVLSQEFPQYATGAFNDAIGFGFVGSNEPGHTDSVGALQKNKDMIWNFKAASTLVDDYVGKTAGFTSDQVLTDDNLSITADLELGNSSDAVGANNAHGGAQRFGGATSTTGGELTTITKEIEIPRAMQSGTQTFLMAIGDVGDQRFDSALVIHSVTVK